MKTITFPTSIASRTTETSVVSLNTREGKHESTIEIGDDATLNLFLVGEFNGTTKLSEDLTVTMGENAILNLYGLILTRDASTFATNTRTIHKGKNAKSTTTFRGAAFDSSAINIVGTIEIPKTGQLASAKLDDKVLLLGENATADVVPNLEILANDAKATHAASVGEIDQEQVFYLQSRGLTATEAERMILDGFFGEFLAHVPNLDVCRSFQQFAFNTQ